MRVRKFTDLLLYFIFSCIISIPNQSQRSCANATARWLKYRSCLGKGREKEGTIVSVWASVCVSVRTHRVEGKRRAGYRGFWRGWLAGLRRRGGSFFLQCSSSLSISVHFCWGLAVCGCIFLSLPVVSFLSGQTTSHLLLDWLSPKSVSKWIHGVQIYPSIRGISVWGYFRRVFTFSAIFFETIPQVRFTSFRVGATPCVPSFVWAPLTYGGRHILSTWRDWISTTPSLVLLRWNATFPLNISYFSLCSFQIGWMGFNTHNRIVDQCPSRKSVGWRMLNWNCIW